MEDLLSIQEFAGSVELTIQGNKPAAQRFEAGKEYYVDFTEAPTAAA